MATERTVLVRLKAETNDFVRGMGTAAAAVKGLTKEVDTSNDRTAWFAQSILALGPALVPLGAAATPILSGLTMQMGLAAGAAGVAALAFVGIGDALKSVNTYQLEPTAENLAKMNLALEKFGPSGAEFVTFLDSVGSKFGVLQMDARAGMFPGMEDGITSLLDLLPRIRPIVSDIAQAIGELSASAGAGLAGEGFRDFFEYLDGSAKPLLVEMGQTIGNFVEGVAAMLVAFAPLTASFSRGLDSMSASFAEWAHGLDESSSFQSFLAYVQQSGPKAIDLLASLSDAFVAIVQAAAPVGDVMLPLLSHMLDIVAALAQTPLGPIFLTAAAAMSAYGRAAALASITTGGLGKALGATFSASALKDGFGALRTGAVTLDSYTTSAERAGMSSRELARSTQIVVDAESKRNSALRSGAVEMGKAAAVVGGLALATSGAADKMGMANTASLALMGTMAGPWGAAVGAGIGLAMDFAASNDALEDSFARLKLAMDAATPSPDSMAAFDAQIASSLAHLNELKAAMSSGDTGGDSWNPFGDEVKGDLARFKNEVEGWFGSSDVEEYEASLAAAQKKAADLRNESTLTGASSRELAQAMDQAAAAALDEAGGIEASISAMRAKRNETLLAENAELAYASALIDGRAAARESGRVLRANGEILDQTSQASVDAKGKLIAMASGWNNLSDAAQDSRGAHRNAIGAFVAVAVQMGMNEGAARRYAQSLYEIPPRRQTVIDLNTSAASMQVAAIKSQLASIDRSIDVYVNIRRPNAGGFGPQIAAADGDTVPKTGLPYADRHPYLLADGEEVISNRYGQADRHRDLLKAINANRLADGGTASRYATPARSASSAPVVVSPQSLQGIAIEGHVSVNGMDGYIRGTVREELGADQRFDKVRAGQ